MSHIIEPAASGRAKCRGCKRPIRQDELRFGERLPNPFADGDMTIWFHLPCAAFRRPASLNEVLDDYPEVPAGTLREAIRTGLEFHRLERIAGIGRSPSNRARCRSCRVPIEKDRWRIGLEFFEEGTFNPAGYIHVSCAHDYFETSDILERLSYFGNELDGADLKDISENLEAR